MNHSPFWPLVWKEYRTSRAFWLAMAVMGLVAQAGVYLLSRQPIHRDWWLYGIALMISAGFAVGIGGTLFAVEHEERTIAFLRRLPVRAGQLGAAKMLAALAGLVTLLALLWLAASVLAGWRSLPQIDAEQLWRLWGLACLEGLAWGILCSLTIRSPLYATVAAALTVAAIVFCAGTMTKYREFSAASYTETIPQRTALLVLVALVDAVLLPRWLEGHFPKRHARFPAICAWRPGWRQSVAHLAWQTFREGWTSFVVLIIAGPLALNLLARFGLRGVLGIGLFGRTDWVWSLLPLTLLAALDGALVFRADQIHGPRFLAEKGVSPRTIWFSRHLVWGCWLWALTAAIALLFAGLLSMLLLLWIFGRLHDGGHHFFLIRGDRLLGAALGFWQVLLPAYAAGQLGSLLMRRGLLAVTLGLLLGMLTTAWVCLMLLIGASWWWSVLPLPVGMLLATWLRLPAWLVDRRDWRSWVAPAAAVLVPVAALSIVVPVYRVRQIPWEICALRPPATSPAAIADARTTLDLYSRAWDLQQSTREASAGNELSSDGGTKQRADEAWRKPVVDLIVEASRHDANLLVLPVVERRAAESKIENLADFLLQYADDQSKTGQLDAALDALLASLPLQVQFHACGGSDRNIFTQTFAGLQAWAAAPDQTAERIRAAIERLKQAHAALPTPEARLLPEYQATALAIDDLPAAAAADMLPGNKIDESQWLTSQLVWERARARRLLDCLATMQLDQSKEIVVALADGKPTVGITLSGFDVPRIPERVLSNRISVWLATTPLVEQSPLASHALPWSLLRQETDYRATLIVMALEAWKAEQGEFPERLDELVDTMLETLPLDPLWARPFLYYPHGLGGLARNGWLRSQFGDFQSLGDRQAFLWSALNQQTDNRRSGSREPAYLTDTSDVFQPIRPKPPRSDGFIYRRIDYAGSPVVGSEVEVLQAGHVYPIAKSPKEQP